MELASGILSREYTTTTTLIEGKIYNLQVHARNSVGYSLASDPISVLVAQEPDQPENVQSIVGDGVVVIQW